MTLRNSIIIIISAFVFYSCGGSKEITSFENAPLWVKEKPVNAEYYIGIGSAVKTQNPASYQANAKNNALSDLSSDISVNISSNSALYQLENSFGYTENYQSRIKASSNEMLNGYELVSSFDSDTHYWVYYRLSKSLYKELKQNKIKSKSQIGLDYYTKAIEAKNNNDYFNALIFYLKGIDAIKDYLTESLEVNYNDNSILLGNEIVSGIATTINDIIITPQQTQLRIKPGNNSSNKQLDFSVTNLQQTPLVNIPIIFSFGTRPIRNNKSESDFKGNVNYSINQFKQNSITYYFTAKLDIQSIAKQALVDPLIRQMVNSIDLPSGKIKIIIESPSIFIQSSEKNINIDLINKPVENKAKQLLSNSKYKLVDSKNAADYILEFDLNTSSSKQDGKMHYAMLNGSIKLYNKDNQIILIKPIENIQGVQIDYEKAGLNAYENFLGTMETTLIMRIKQSLN